MKLYNIVRNNTYFDSVTLMLISRQLKALEGIDDVSVMMGTPANRSILRDAGLLGEEGAAAGPNDLIMAFRATEGIDVSWVCGKIDEQLKGKITSGAKTDTAVLPSAEKAYRESPGANLAFISVPGEYAAIEAQRALKHGKNVFLFSDNVTIGEEARLKHVAAGKGLLVMGPDCGTAIINGVGIGFANRVRRGNVGVIAASGTGLQEVTCLLDAMGLGVSQAIGTGGRDLKEEIGAATMLQALDFLLSDPDTATIILISKPPAQAVAAKILARLAGAGKPCVLCFVGYKPAEAPIGVEVAATLEEAALQVARLSGVKPDLLTPPHLLKEWTIKARATLAPQRKAVRALYCGGTLCYETMLIMSERLGPVYANIALDKELIIHDVIKPGAHSAIDLGEDEFTRGRPHPMIDGTLRHELIAKVADDRECAVLLLDVIIGYGAGEDPAGELVPVLAALRGKGGGRDRGPAVVAYVCGTDRDEPRRQEQAAKLAAAGVYVARTNAEAARLACTIAGAEVSGDETR
jgi:FdrA protein